MELSVEEHKISIESNENREALIEQITAALQKLPLKRLNTLAKSFVPKESKTFSINEAALELEVSYATIRRAIKNGTIKAIQLNKSGKSRIPKEEITRFFTKGISHHD